VVVETGIRDYAHQVLNQQYGGQSGYYIPRREVRLDFHGLQVLYIVGHAVVESSCCGTGNWDYVLVPGFIVNWQCGHNRSGLPTTVVEPLGGAQHMKELTSLIQSKENISCITFW
jgi:hypothetical protein